MDVYVHKMDAGRNFQREEQRGWTRTSIHPFFEVCVYFAEALTYWIKCSES